MNMKRTMAAVLSAAMVLTAGAAALAADNAKGNTVTNAPAAQQTVAVDPTQTAPYRLGAQATVTALDLTGEHPSITIQTTDKQTLQLNVSAETVVLDTKTGVAASLTEVKKGAEIYAYYSPAMTRSIPAQTACEAIVINLEKEHSAAKLLTAETVTQNTDGSVTVLAENGTLLLTVPADAAVTPYRTKNIVKNTDIRMGTRFFAWYDVVALSMPGQASTAKAVILPQQETEDTITIVHQGDIAIDEAKMENGVVMVPLRKTAEALGFKVTWNGKENSVHLTNGTVQTSVALGQDSYYTATALKDAVGMSAPSPLGAAAYEKNGTSWVPAELFNLLLEGNPVTLKGTTLYL